MNFFIETIHISLIKSFKLTHKMPSKAKLARMAEEKAKRVRTNRIHNFITTAFIPRVKSVMEEFTLDELDGNAKLLDANFKIMLYKLEREAYPYFEEKLEEFIPDDGNDSIQYNCGVRANARCVAIYLYDGADFEFVIYANDKEPDYTDVAKQQKAISVYASLREKERKHVAFTYNRRLRGVNWYEKDVMSKLIVELRNAYRDGAMRLPESGKQKVIIDGKKYYTIGISELCSEADCDCAYMKQDPLGTGVGLEFVGKLYFFVSKTNRDVIFDYITGATETEELD